MRRLLAICVGAVSVAVLALLPATSTTAAAPVARAAAACPDEDLVPDADNLPRVENAVLCLVNRERTAIGLAPLARSSRLDRSANFHTVDMVRSHYLGHEAPGHPTLLARVRGYGYFVGATGGLYAENVGVGAQSNGTAGALMDAWMASPAHRVNLLFAAFRDIGISAVMAPPDPAFFADYPSTVYTTDFGRRYVSRRCVKPSRPGTTGTAPASPRRRYCRPRR